MAFTPTLQNPGYAYARKFVCTCKILVQLKTHSFLQNSEPQNAMDLRGFVVIKEPECSGGTQKFAFKLVKYGSAVTRHYFHCRTENEMIG